MPYLYNNPGKKNLRKKLRKQITDAERKLWQVLRRRQVCGLKFIKQYGIGNYVVDFYCPKCRLAIEADGGQHAENIAYDNERTKYLNQIDIKVLRFWNNEILQNIDGVGENIRLAVIERLKKINNS
ncbi:endonuclease domain-containing protein [Patescibacteria group bacterium]|nr:endonuclease domain-containing protein [Patescibacteria group bacterium]